MRDIVNPPCNGVPSGDAEVVSIGLETLLEASLRERGERVPNDSWNPDGWKTITEGMRERAEELGLIVNMSACEACAADEHSECSRPAKYRGHPRGDNFEIVHCCCYEDPDDIDGDAF